MRENERIAGGTLGRMKEAADGRVGSEVEGLDRHRKMVSVVANIGDHLIKDSGIRFLERKSPMYSVIRENFYDPAKLAKAGKQMDEFEAAHAAQPGYRGHMVVDLGIGHMVIVTLWETEPLARKAREALEPEIQRLLVPLMAQPSHLIGAGPVMVSDLKGAVIDERRTA